MIHISQVLHKALDRKRHKGALRGAHLMALWPRVIEDLVGEQASMGSRVESLKGNTLIVRTGSPVLANELRLHAPLIIRKLNSKIHAPVVARLQFRI